MKIQKFKIEVVEYVKSKIAISQFCIIITLAFLLMFSQSHERGEINDFEFIKWVMIFVGVFSAELTIMLTEMWFQYREKHPPKKRWKRKPKVFEYLFFFCLFMATLASTLMSSEYYSRGMSVSVLENYFWFTSFYGISLVSGIYHYIYRLDDDDVEIKKNTKKDNKKKNISGERREMPNIMKKLVPNRLALFGWLIVAWGFLCIVLGLVVEKGNYLFGFGAFGLGFISIGIAFHAMAQAEESDKKISGQIEYSNRGMKSMVRSEFHGIIDKLQRSRFNFFRNIQNLMSGRTNELQFHLEVATWESVTHFQRAKLLQEWIEPEDERILLRYLRILIRNILQPNFMGILKYRHLEHLLISCKEACNFSVIEEFETGLINLFRNYIGDKEDRDRDFKEYVERKIRQVKVRGLENIFQRFS